MDLVPRPPGDDGEFTTGSGVERLLAAGSGSDGSGSDAGGDEAAGAAAAPGLGPSTDGAAAPTGEPATWCGIHGVQQVLVHACMHSARL